MTTLNRGEWAEFYVFLKLLKTFNLEAVNSKLSKTGTSWPIRYMLHDSQQNGITKYSEAVDRIHLESNSVSKKIDKSNVEDIAEKTILAIREPKKIRESKRTFSVDSVNENYDLLGMPVIKQNNKRKTDLTIALNQPYPPNEVYEFGFSVKSNLAGKVTLINASQQTNFIFQLTNECETFGKKPKEIVKLIGGQNLIYIKVASETYEMNMEFIDSTLPKMLSWMLIKYYSGVNKRIEDLIYTMENENPLNLNNVQTYKRKIGDFLMASALGMVPGVLWNGNYEADGGMLVLKEDTDIGAFFIADSKYLNELRNYLICSAFFDTASTTKHKFGSIYRQNGINHIKLSMQIRLDH